MREITPATFLSVYCEHVWIRVHIIAHFHIVHVLIHTDAYNTH